jgi:anti-sigma factor RsiW
LDGELGEAEARRLEAALAETPDLREQRTDYESLRTWLREENLPAGQPPEAAWADIRRRRRLADGESAGNEGVPFGSRLRWATALVLALFCMLGLWVTLNDLRVSTFAADQADPTAVEWAETELENSYTMVYRDDEMDLTIIWIMEEDAAERPKIDS